MEPTDTPASGRNAARQTAQRHIALGAVIGLALVGVVVASFGVMLMPPQNAMVSSAMWPVYHDGLNMFRLRLPPEWKAVEQYPEGNYIYTTPQGEFSGQLETIDISDPAQGAASASLEIDVQQFPSAIAVRATYCTARKQETANFNGYPATINTLQPAVILFESSDAHFQIDVTIPGVLVPAHTSPLEATPSPTATPLPAATVTSDYALLAAALATFQPTDAHPLICS